MNNSAMCHISTDGEKFWPFFGVLPCKIPCGEPEILQFYLYGRQPLLSILKKRYKFDQCVGCVDGTHIPIRKPINNEVVYVSRYGYHSLNTMVSIKMNNLSYKIK